MVKRERGGGERHRALVIQEARIVMHLVNIFVHTYSNVKYYNCDIYYLAPGGGCEVLFSPGLSV